jgi:hypothetical protein
MEDMTEQQRAAERAALFAEWDREHQSAVEQSREHREQMDGEHPAYGDEDARWGLLPSRQMDPDAGAAPLSPVDFVPFDPEPGRGLIPAESLPNGETRPDPARSGPDAPEPFTARKHQRKQTRSASGRSSFIVTGRGPAPVSGQWDRTADGEPVSAEIRAALSGHLLPDVHAMDGAWSTRDLDRLASVICPDVEPLVGTDALSWHQMHRGEIDAPSVVRWIAPDPWTAAVWSGLIEAPRTVTIRDRDGLVTDVAERIIALRTREGTGSRVPLRSRSVPSHRVRLRLRSLRPRLSDVETGRARRVERITAVWSDDDGCFVDRSRLVTEWIPETADDDGVIRLRAPWITADRMWIGHALVDRGPVKSRTGRRVRLRPAVPTERVPVDSLRLRLPGLVGTLRGLRVGERLTVTDGTGLRVTFSRAEQTEQYRYTLQYGEPDARRTLSRSRFRTAAAAIGSAVRSVERVERESRDQ